MIRVLVVSDIRLYREGLAEFLRRDSSLVVDAVADADRAVARVEETPFDIVLVDCSMARSTVLIGRLVVARARVLTLATPVEDTDVIEVAESGVAGFVTRESSLEELLAAIRDAARGETVCPPPMAASLLRRVVSLGHERLVGEPAHRRLTSREAEIVELIDERLSNKEIAARLHIELPTVKNHVHNILEKLQVNGRLAAVETLRADEAAQLLRRARDS